MKRTPAPVHALPVGPSHVDHRASASCPCRPLAYIAFATRAPVWVHVDVPRPIAQSADPLQVERIRDSAELLRDAQTGLLNPVDDPI